MSLRVLVVDDSATGRLIVKTTLEALGCEVEIAENGLQALERQARGQFELILMDSDMPVMDGISATRLITARCGNAARVIAATAYDDALEHAALRQAGAAEVLVKPLTRECLSDLLERGRAAPAPGSGESAPEPVLDEEMIDSLRAIGGPRDRGFLGRVIDSFCEAGEGGCAELRRAFERGQWRELAAAAHALRGASLQVGARHLASTCARLEEALTCPPVADQVAEAERQLARAVCALRRLPAPPEATA